MNISHEELHDRIETMDRAVADKQNTLLKWLVATVIAVIGVTMTQIISVSASLAEVAGTQELVLQSLNRFDRSIETIQVRIQDESREAEEDLRSHLDREHAKE
jgi:hypothetical protein